MSSNITNMQQIQKQQNNKTIKIKQQMQQVQQIQNLVSIALVKFVREIWLLILSITGGSLFLNALLLGLLYNNFESKEMSSDNQNKTFSQYFIYNSPPLSTKMMKQLSQPTSLYQNCHENSQRQLLISQIQAKQKIIARQKHINEEKKQQLNDLRKLLIHVNNENDNEISNIQKQIKLLSKQVQGYKVALNTVYDGGLGSYGLFWANECQ